MAFFFHNVFGTGNWVADLVLFLLILFLLVVSNIAIFRGGRYLVKYWRDFSPRWQKALISSIPVIMLLMPVSPVHIAWLSFPFGIFAGLPILFFIDSPGVVTYYMIGGIGTMLNLIGFIGVFGSIEKKTGRLD